MDQRRAVLLIVSAAMLLGAWRWVEAATMQPEDAEAADSALDLMDEAIMRVASVTGAWRAPEEYAPAIAAAEARHGLPVGLLERVLYQESRYRADIISGATRSPAGAVGIAQFMSGTARWLGVDPLNVGQAIDGAGRYLRMLFDQFGAWNLALAAYNWGSGNVSRRGIDAAPRETVAYVNDILGDVPV